jgi:hypothetical protein
MLSPAWGAHVHCPTGRGSRNGSAPLAGLVLCPADWPKSGLPASGGQIGRRPVRLGRGANRDHGFRARPAYPATPRPCRGLRRLAATGGRTAPLRSGARRSGTGRLRARPRACCWPWECRCRCPGTGGCLLCPPGSARRCRGTPAAPARRADTSSVTGGDSLRLGDRVRSVTALPRSGRQVGQDAGEPGHSVADPRQP